jgi:hypothetical protein
VSEREREGTFSFGRRFVEEKVLWRANGVESGYLLRHGLEALLLVVPVAAAQLEQEPGQVLHVCNTHGTKRTTDVGVSN